MDKLVKLPVDVLKINVLKVLLTMDGEKVEGQKITFDVVLSKLEETYGVDLVENRKLDVKKIIKNFCYVKESFLILKEKFYKTKTLNEFCDISGFIGADRVNEFSEKYKESLGRNGIKLLSNGEVEYYNCEKGAINKFLEENKNLHIITMVDSGGCSVLYYNYSAFVNRLGVYFGDGIRNVELWCKG